MNLHHAINSAKHPRRHRPRRRRTAIHVTNTTPDASVLKPAKMARAHRVAIYASTFLIVYLVVFFSVLPVPFLEPEVAAQLLPVVRTLFSMAPKFRGLLCTLALTPRFVMLDSMVAPRVFWRLFPRFSRLGPVHFSRLPKCVSHVAQGEGPRSFHPKSWTLIVLFHAASGNQRGQRRFESKGCHRGLAGLRVFMYPYISRGQFVRRRYFKTICKRPFRM